MGKTPRLKSHGHEARLMTNAFEHGSKQYAFIIAIASAQRQNGVGGMNRFDAVNVFQIANFIANKRMERLDFGNPSLLRQAASERPCLCAHRRACFSLARQLAHYF